MRQPKLLVLFLFALFLASAPATFAQRAVNAAKAKPAATDAATTPAERNAEFITAAEMRDYLYFVASDEMEGRNTPSRGLDLTAKFIALNLSRWGIKPMGDNGTYFQKIPLVRSNVNAAQSTARIGAQTFNFGTDFLPAGDKGGKVSGNLVFVGYGWQIKSKGIDAYAGVDVRDKVVVVTGNGLPPGVTFTDLQGGKQGVDWSDPITYAAQSGARAVLIVPAAQTLARWEQMRQRITANAPVHVAGDEAETPQVPALLMAQSMTDALFQNESLSAAQVNEARNTGGKLTAFAFNPDKQVSFDLASSQEKVYTQNVVGVLEGSDPQLKNEYVAIGAHYDHVGIGGCGRNNGEDNICNGADDDGSGTVGVLTIAHAFAQSNPKPKRSILFVWHAGEEKGLWGSSYFVEHPTVPLTQVVTQLNIDMIGRSKKPGDTNPKNAELSGESEIYVIGSKMMSSDLATLSERVNDDYLKLNFNYRYDNPNDPNRFFFRSDHFNYARKGVPIIFYFDGEHEDYHQAGDSPDKIDYAKMERVARTIFVTGYELANSPARPKIDRKLPPELRGN